MFRFYLNCQRWKPSHDQWISAIRCLPLNEVTRLDQNVFQHDVKFALIGQLLIRYLLVRVFHQKSSSFEIQRSSSGRPFVVSHPSVDFNLSHQHRLVAIAGSLDGRIGCDTMVYRTKKVRHNYQKLARRILASEENKFLFEHSSDELTRLSCFYRLWSLKESYVKWLGQGVSFPLSTLNFHISTVDIEPTTILSDTRLSIDPSLRFDEQLISFADDDQQLITVCVSHPNPCRPFVELSIDDLLDVCTPIDEDRADLEQYWQSFENKQISSNQRFD